MAFASIHVPQMIVQAVMRHEPHLRAGSLALVDGTPPLVRVIAANDSALSLGIQPGMAKSQAAQFSGIEIRNRAPAQEKAAQAALLDLGWSISPRIENTAADTIVLDLAGLKPLFGSDESIAHELLHRALHLGLAANVAVAAAIDVAIVASRGFSGVTVIPPGEESARLGILPVSVLLPSTELLETLDRWGVRTCRDLATLPPSIFPSVWARKAFVCINWPAAYPGVLWRWPNQACISRKNSNSILPKKNSSPYLFCWDASSINCARACKPVRSPPPQSI